MTPLQSQYQRLYQLPPSEGGIAEPDGPTVSHGQVRALVLALGRPADWATVSPVWRGVQADLDWPAPAIAVNGVDAFELWFSLAQPVSLNEAVAVLQGLRMRYLTGAKPQRVQLWPSIPSTPWGMPRIPALLAPGRWSAFVAPDLAGVFGGDDPSLDVQPGESAQAELLSRLRCIGPSEWQAAMALLLPLAPIESAVAAQGISVARTAVPVTQPLGPGENPSHGAPSVVYHDPARFLLDVMNDPAAPLALRVDAAKALLSKAEKPAL